MKQLRKVGIQINMAKLYFNNSNLNKDVKPSITSTVEYLSKVIIDSNSLVIPGSFEYARELKDFSYNIKKIKDELIKINEWIDFSNRNYDNTMNEIDDGLKQIDDLEIKAREKLVS